MQVWQWCQGRQRSGSDGAFEVQLAGPQQSNVATTLGRLQARQTNFTQHSVDALCRRIAVHIAFPEVGDLAEGTQADAAATDAYTSSGATNTHP